jgi:hypothetical protein
MRSVVGEVQEGVRRQAHAADELDPLTFTGSL